MHSSRGLLPELDALGQRQVLAPVDRVGLAAFKASVTEGESCGIRGMQRGASLLQAVAQFAVDNS